MVHMEMEKSQSISMSLWNTCTLDEGDALKWVEYWENHGCQFDMLIPKLMITRGETGYYVEVRCLTLGLPGLAMQTPQSRGYCRDRRQETSQEKE